MWSTGLCRYPSPYDSAEVGSEKFKALHLFGGKPMLMSDWRARSEEAVWNHHRFHFPRRGGEAYVLDGGGLV